MEGAVDDGGKKGGCDQCSLRIRVDWLDWGKQTGYSGSNDKSGNVLLIPCLAVKL